MVSIALIVMIICNIAHLRFVCVCMCAHVGVSAYAHVCAYEWKLDIDLDVFLSHFPHCDIRSLTGIILMLARVTVASMSQESSCLCL